MIDLRLVREEPDLVRDSQRRRGADVALVDALIAADGRRRAATTRFDTLRAEQRQLGKQIPRATGEERAALLARAGELSAAVKSAEAELSEAARASRTAHLAVANVVSPDAPVGGEDDYVVLEQAGRPRAFDFEVRDHLELGTLLGAIDTERAAKVSGARFYFLTGVGALLELALVNLAVAQATAAGFVPVVPPVLVKPEAMEGTGFLGEHAAEVYHLPADDLYLVGTSEVPLAALHSDEILDPDDLPLRYAGISPCFRREAGSYGKDTRGIIRVHQFDKVEMFVFADGNDPAVAAAEHRRLLAVERAFLDAVEVPYRVIDVATGDLGPAAERKFDCEAWVPSQGRYREVTSTSNCTGFQSRRLGIRQRGGSGSLPVATLNGTMCAIPRMIVAVLENHQQSDGSVVVPAALRPYLGGCERFEPVRR